MKKGLIFSIIAIAFVASNTLAFTEPEFGPEDNGTIINPISTEATPQTKLGSLWAYFFGTEGGIRTSGKLTINIPELELPGFLSNPDQQVLVEGKVGAKEYCDVEGKNCINATNPGLSGDGPDYDSDWVEVPRNGTPYTVKDFIHGLSTNDYIVYIEGSQYATSSPFFSIGTNQIGFGGDKFGASTRGFYYVKSAVPGTLSVYRYNYDYNALYLRVKIWKIDTTTRQDIYTENVPPADVQVPLGAVLPFYSASCPNHWQEFSEVNDRFIVGATITISSKGGTSTVTLTAVNLPIHTHGYSQLSGASDSTVGSGIATFDNAYNQKQAPSDTTSVKDGKAKPDSFSIIPAYYSLKYCKKISKEDNEI